MIWFCIQGQIITESGMFSRLSVTFDSVLEKMMFHKSNLGESPLTQILSIMEKGD